MTVAVVGGGMLGLTLAWRLAGRGGAVDLLEAAPEIGGLAAPCDYGEFRWDRFYHCLLPSDERLIGLLRELDLAPQLRWTPTRTGYFGRGRFHEMTGGADFLRFPLLSFLQKARLGTALAIATRFADPGPLYETTAAEWLARLCGARTFEIFWKPLLRAKFGAYHDRVAAVFLWATLQRLWKRPAAGAPRGTLGYVRGGYDAILARMRERLTGRGVRIETGVTIDAIRSDGDASAPRCAIDLAAAGGPRETRSYDQVLFTAPLREARRLASRELLPAVEKFGADHPAAATYLGVVCVVLVLTRPLTPYYVLNLGDESIDLTGVIEMTNLVDRSEETAGRTLVYLPRYVDSADPLFEQPDAALLDHAVGRLRRLFPDLKDEEISVRRVHRARHVQALPTVAPRPRAAALPTLERPFQVVNSALLRAATLNNNEIVGLADDFVAANLRALPAPAAAGAVA